MPFNFPNPIEPLTPADAVEVEHNNVELRDYINANVITRDGVVSMNAPLRLVAADPISDDEAARKGYVDALLPIGTMMLYGADGAPAGRWKLCDGSSLQTAAFPKLFAVLQYRYGGSGGSFKLPDLRHRLPVGLDTADTRFNAAGKAGGSFEAPIPQHKHTMAHDHGQFNSGNQSVGHTHKITHDHGQFNSGAQSAGHTHTINHDHLNATTSTVADHQHAMSQLNNAEINGVGQRALGYVAGQGSYLSTGPSGGHAHALNLPTFSGNSGAQSASHTHPINVPQITDDSGGVSANHTHPVNVPAFTGDTGNTGTAGVDFVAPYVTVTYIIRTD